MMERKRKGLSQPPPSCPKKRTKKHQNENSEEHSTQFENTGRAGRIEEIQLRNFMCHTALDIKFEPNTNYIIGRNGSGKSAVLTALIVGLGGKARDTNRGSNLKAFIKNGQNSASIEITLSNTGLMAYNPNMFGKKIIIIKTINDSGSASYKLKTETGETVSTSCREISRLTDSLNIYVDNPICILNQDVARTFLNSNDPQKKYMMFMQATNLANIKNQYKIAMKNKTKTVDLLEEKSENLQKLEKEVKKWLKKYKAFEIMEDVEAKKKHLELETVWSDIYKMEQELEEMQKIVDVTSKDIQEFSNFVKNKDTLKNTLTETINQIKEQLIEIRNEEEANRKKMELKRNELQKFRETVLERKNRMNITESTIKRKETDIKNIEEEISKFSAHQNNRLKMIEERDASITYLEQKLSEISKLMETTEHDFTQTRNALKLKKQEENTLKTELNEISGKVRQHQAKIRSINADLNSTVSIYGTHMQKILDSINASKEQFIKMPRGPIGSYVKLKDKTWALALEELISRSMLMSFCVDNQNDAKLLSGIFNEICQKNIKPAIICSKFFDKVHNYSAMKVVVPQNCIAAIDTLIIKDPVVLNCLIDQLSIENILLIPSNAMARQIMSNATLVPRNCSQAVTSCGDVFYPDPNYRSYACHTKNARYLQVSTSDVIKMLDGELQNFLANQTSIKGQLRAVSEDVRKLSHDVTLTQNKLTSLSTIQAKNQRNINDLKLQQLPPEPNVQILTEEMAEITKIIESKQNDLKKLQEEVESVKCQLRDAESEHNSFKQISKALEERMKPLLDEISTSETKLKEIHINAKQHANKIQQYNRKLVEAESNRDKKKKILDKKLQKVESLGPRMDTNRPLETVIAELQETDQQLTEIKMSMGDRLLVSQTYMRIQEKYDQIKTEITEIQNCVSRMEKTVEARVKYYQKIVDYIEIRVREMFSGVLKIRQYKGTINIDHEKHILDLVVIPQCGSSQGKGQTHILSGGEKSYSTVAFIHALWQVMEFPFYFLDEFDVFMDKVNRKVVMDILIEHAKEHSNLQFVFLTPQDISSVLGEKNITIHKLEDPKREKQVGNKS